ncbi:hypothetical protein SPBR_03965 [Sporothrix brasiliensis 5110]|uniref:non-specific serine/threonine protein kinase n=1 Tax=Sporothrix brasiliensis 5110 TaxID=1398154 RepID=A0A0C2J8I1_9PEZI|nr:uncharacterized protein SPBR_03965 [Sporothrix brasiliensis 5110]KIH95305.1 hypothetical protein SPBR_03965 [Sporothrix brasiliensis 5110]
MAHDETMTIQTCETFDPAEKARQLETMIGCGISGIVHLTPCGTMVKKSNAQWRHSPAMRCKQLRNEIAIYKKLPQNHPRLVRFCDSFDDGAMDVWMTLEYMPNGTLEEYLRGYKKFGGDDKFKLKGETYPDFEARIRRRHDSLTLRQRARWCLEAADGIVLLHAYKVIHADIKPENMGVDANLGVRIFDLGSSSLGDQPALGLESTRYFMPRESWDVYSVTTDCFAVGSSIYHIVTGYRPYDAMPDDEVAARFERHEFPDLSGQTTEYEAKYAKDGDTVGVSPVTGQLLFADTIRKCWFGEFATAADVLEALKEEVVATFSGDDLAFIEDASGLKVRVDGARQEI